ncbi:BREX system Lon protease-like protein BrxL [Coprothermobacter platensis]|uniref:BREX system Lon protease-like protein BrxL n=1 Tax=Coprothermobacter platensis TaxID=108819 RepID=UPI00037B53F8|nr:BREX system Lon protease-like protein BrxL [Coprothermobacter platensis]
MGEDLDEKIKDVFPDESVYKMPQNYGVFSGRNIPSFIKDWLIKKFTDEDGVLDKQDLLTYLDNFLPDKSRAQTIKKRLIQTREPYTLLARVQTQADVAKGMIRFSMPDFAINPGEGVIPKSVVEAHPDLLADEIWGIFTLIYEPADGNERGQISIMDFKPFKPYEIDLDYFKDGRKEFSLDEWIDVLIRAMEYMPKGFDSMEQRLLFISRLLVFAEPRLNMIELAPKGTGKSYIFNNLTKYGWCISGGTVTRAKMFYDVSRRSFGYITRYDFVALDEIETIKFAEEEELKGALKNYLELGKFTIADVTKTSEAGFMLLGNIPLTSDRKPINNIYFSHLPSFFQDSALLDRFHGFIEGWYLPRINEDMKVSGYTLNVEFFSEVLHKLRDKGEYAAIVDEMLYIPPKADTRDVTAVKRLCSAYLKILFPHVTDPSGITKEEFETYCLKPALEKRAIVKKQIHLMDPEFREAIPDIVVKEEHATT